MTFNKIVMWIKLTTTGAISLIAYNVYLAVGGGI